MDDPTLRLILTAAGSSAVSVLMERLRAKRAERTRAWREQRTERRSNHDEVRHRG